jgi:type IX secretion system PorP/SprF family membrane protein
MPGLKTMFRSATALALVLLPLCTGMLHAQDLHYTQFYHNPMHYNPARTGIFEGQWRAAAQYRSQWTSVPVSYSTFSASFDSKVLKRGTNMLALGLNLQHDRAGDAALTWTQGGVQVSAVHALGEQNAVSVGFGLAAAQRAFDISALKFKNQWTGEVFDPSLGTQEMFNQSSGISPTLSGGLNWYFQSADTRTRVDLGGGVMHLNQPKVTFEDNAAFRLPLRIALQGSANIQVNELLDVPVFALFQEMGPHNETMLGAGVRRILSTGPANFTAVTLSCAVRLDDALAPALQLERNNWTVGLSYDVNTSPFDVATNRRGGIEVAVIYRHVPVPPVKTFKACPIF